MDLMDSVLVRCLIVFSDENGTNAMAIISMLLKLIRDGKTFSRPIGAVANRKRMKAVSRLMISLMCFRHAFFFCLYGVIHQ